MSHCAPDIGSLQSDGYSLSYRARSAPQSRARGAGAPTPAIQREQGHMHPAGVRTVGRVVALADNLVELEIVDHPLGKVDGAHPGDLYVAGLA